MTNFTFDDTIPATNNNPSADQPGMLINNVSTLGLLNIDHVTFNLNNGGTHLQNTYADFSTVPFPASGIGPAASVAYPAAGDANTTNASYFFQNFNSSYLLNCVKAFGVFTAGGGPTFANSYNCASVTGGGTGPYTITLNANVTTGNNVIVFVNTSKGDQPQWVFVGGVLQTITPVTVGSKVCFIILQA